MGIAHRLLMTAVIGGRGRMERRAPFRSVGRIHRAQERRLAAIIRHAYETVPFYRRVMRERGLRPHDFRHVEDLERLPLIDGNAIAEHPEAFRSTRVPGAGQQTFYSTGSPSRPRRLVVWDLAALRRQAAIRDRDRAVLYRLLRKEWGLVRVSFFPESSTSRAVSRTLRGSVFVPRVRDRTIFLPPELPIEEIVERLNEVRPDVVFSYGSFAEHVFRSAADLGLALRPPRVWVYGADRLSAAGQAWIEERFGCLVYSTYSSVEMGRIGFECERRAGFHLNVDLCPLRLVDPQGKTVAAGEVGEVVVSNLENHATVLLNYRLGDLAVMASSPCSCGRSLPLLEHLVGRTSERIRLADGRSVPDFVLVHACKDELRDAARSQLIQEETGGLRWRVVPARGVDREALRAGLLTQAQRALGIGGSLTVELVDAIAHDPREKFTPVIREDGWNAETRKAPPAARSG